MNIANMARTIKEIKKTMTDAFITDATIIDKYKLSEGDTFSKKFSSVSIENILFYIVAACCYIMEVLFDQFKNDVDDKIRCAVVASVPWYHKVALAFQYGDALVLNENTQGYEYEEVNEEHQLVKFVAVRDKNTSVQIIASGEKDGLPAKLSDDVLSAFKLYLNRVKIAGVVLTVRSYNPDRIKVNATIYVDPLVFDLDGSLISDGSRPVDVAIQTYLNNIKFGGTFNKTKLVDAIQQVQGVADIELGECSWSTDNANGIVIGNNFESVGGSFIADDLNKTIVYAVQY